MANGQAMDRMLTIAALKSGGIPRRARRMADFSLFDWLVVARAGIAQPVSAIVRRLIASEGGVPAATVAGAAGRFPARAAALANGTISHALDYDDTHFAHIGHPSVAILPAALAAAEEAAASAADLRDAFLLGAEASVRLGMVLGRGHYERGFHQTATAGAFGATLAAGRLYGLDCGQMRQALSLVSTRSSGLKSQFGTHGKPFNAGIAAANGVEAAKLAAFGLVSCDDGIGGPQGFIASHSDHPDFASPWQDMPPQRFVFEDIKYKLHACCHGTHAMIEALRGLMQREVIAPEATAAIMVHTHPRWLAVCDITAPRTGLEAKFSYRLLAAMVVSGIDTASEENYRDSLCADAGLQGLAARVSVVGDPSLTDLQVRVIVTPGDGQELDSAYDLAVPPSDDELVGGLRRKAAGLLGEDAAERIWSLVQGLDGLSARDLATGVFGPLAH